MKKECEVCKAVISSNDIVKVRRQCKHLIDAIYECPRRGEGIKSFADLDFRRFNVFDRVKERSKESL